MNDTKRFVIAMALMLGVLVLLQIYSGSQRQPAQPPDTAGKAGTSDTSPSAPERATGQASGQAESGTAEQQTGAVVPAFGILPAEEGPGREIVVTAPLYTARFSSRGAVLTSFTLTRYPLSKGGPVELVAAGDIRPFGVALLTKTGDRIDLAAGAFTVSAESLAVPAGAETTLAFVLTTAEGLTVTKTCRFRSDTYIIMVDIEVTGPGSEAVRAVEFGWQSGLQSTELNRNDDLRNFAAITLTDQGLVKADAGKVRKNQQFSVGGVIEWAGLRTKYFWAGFVPTGKTQVISRSFPGNGESIGMAVEAERDPVKPLGFMVYVGPLDYQELKAIGHRLEKAVDFGWKWMAPLSKLIFMFLVACYKVIPNYGWVIILLSGLTKLLFHPLTQKSMKSMRAMQKLQPEMTALREKHKKDPQTLNKAVMELYRKRGVNPMGGCLPLVLQMPVFIALFNVLSKTIELRQAEFIFWIKDLSAPDVIARLPFAIPFIGSVISLLPILMGIAMFVQQKMTTSDPKQAMMTYLLPVVFTFMFFRFPSGLVLYWLVNNILTIIHQYLMNRADRLEQQQVTTGG